MVEVAPFIWNGKDIPSRQAQADIEAVAGPNLYEALNLKAKELGKRAEVFTCTFPYGEIIAGYGILNDPNLRHMLSVGDIALGIVLSGSVEIFEDLYDPKREPDTEAASTYPVRILSPGKLIGLFEILDRNFHVAKESVGAPWSLSSGARSIHILGNISGADFAKKLKIELKKLKNQEVQLNAIASSWSLATAISNHLLPQWVTKIAFFPDRWTTVQDEQKTRISPLHQILASAGWNAARFYLGHADTLLRIWMHKVPSVNKSDLEYTRQLLWRLSMTLAGDLPGFVPFRFVRNAGPFAQIADVLHAATDEKRAQILVPEYLSPTAARSVLFSFAAETLGYSKLPSGETYSTYVEKLKTDIKKLFSHRPHSPLNDASIVAYLSDAAGRMVIHGVNEDMLAGHSTDYPYANLQIPTANLKIRPNAIRSHVYIRPTIAYSTTKAEVGELSKSAFQFAKSAPFFKAALRLAKDQVPDSVLNEIAFHEIATRPPSDKTAIVIHHHLLPSAIPLMDHLMFLVHSPRQIFVLGKSYSTIANVEHRLKECEFRVFPDAEQRIAEPGAYEDRIEKNIRQFWDFVEKAHGERAFERLIICDDGGRLAHLMPASLRAKVNAIVVEQTSSGSVRSDGCGLPVVDVGRSAAKQNFESGIIADAVLQEIKKRGIPLDSNVGVLGYGFIGRKIAERLLPSVKQVIVFDPKTMKDSNNHRLSFVKSPIELVGECSTILGCSGQQAIKTTDIQKNASKLHLVSCSSGDLEFQEILKDFGLRPSKIYADKIEGEVSGRAVVVWNGGFPINFNRECEVEPEEAIMLTRALSFAGICLANQLLDSKPDPGRIMLDPALQRWVCQMHSKNYKTPTMHIHTKPPASWSAESEGRPAVPR